MHKTKVLMICKKNYFRTTLNFIFFKEFFFYVLKLNNLGGSGFVGQYLIEDLKAKNVKIYALARSGNNHKEKDI